MRAGTWPGEPREPTRSGPSSSRSTRSIVGVHSGQRATSTISSQIFSDGTSMRRKVLKRRFMDQWCLPGSSGGGHQIAVDSSLLWSSRCCARSARMCPAGGAVADLRQNDALEERPGPAGAPSTRPTASPYSAPEPASRTANSSNDPTTTKIRKGSPEEFHPRLLTIPRRSHVVGEQDRDMATPISSASRAASSWVQPPARRTAR